MRHICIKTVGRLAVGENDHDLLCASAAVFQNLLCPIDAVLNVRAAVSFQTAASASEQRIQLIGIFRLCQARICIRSIAIADNRNLDALFIAGRCVLPKELIDKVLRRRFSVLQLVVIIHRAGQVNDQNGVDLGCRYLRRFALHRDGDFRDAFFLIHPLGGLCRLNAALRRVDRGSVCRHSCDRQDAEEHQHCKHDAQKAFFHVLLSPCVKFSYVL